MKNSLPINIKRLTLVIAVTLFAVFGLSLITRQDNIGTSSASAQEPADINSDSVVDIVDLSILLSNWNTTDNLSDLNNDNIVDIVDLSILLSKWGTVPVVGGSGTPMPVGDVTSGGHTWTQVLAEDFTKDAALGSWGSDCSTDVVYTGSTGVQWKAYPKCYLDTYQKRPYRSDKVLSVHDGMLDFWLHTVDGKPAGANPSPLMPNGSAYQTYGRYEARIRQSTTDLSDYHQAWLLWPQNHSDWECAESDFPEAKMSGSSINAYHHYGCSGSQKSYSATVDKTEWHTYTQEWMPGVRNYYVDGVLIGSSTHSVYDKPQRWQLQTETNTNCDSTGTCDQDGHLLVDWAVVYAY